MRPPPCNSCPWRVGANADAIPGFSMDLAEELVATTGREFGAPVFACHQSRPGKEVHCAGWLAVYGINNIGIRLSIVAEVLDPVAVAAPPGDWPALYPTFDDMVANLRETYTGVPTPEAAEAVMRMADREFTRRIADEASDG